MFRTIFVFDDTGKISNIYKVNSKFSMMTQLHSQDLRNKFTAIQNVDYNSNHQSLTKDYSLCNDSKTANDCQSLDNSCDKTTNPSSDKLFEEDDDIYDLFNMLDDSNEERFGTIFDDLPTSL